MYIKLYHKYINNVWAVNNKIINKFKKNGISCNINYYKQRSVIPLIGIPKENNNKIGYIGRFSNEKNIQLLIESINKIKTQLNGYSFVVAGSGVEEENLKKLTNMYNLNGIIEFVGPLHGTDISNFYHSIDYVVITSVTEGMPCTIIEALSHSTPVIAPRIGGIPDVIEHNVNGKLFDMLYDQDIVDIDTFYMIDFNKLIKACMRKNKENIDNLSSAILDATKNKISKKNVIYADKPDNKMITIFDKLFK